MDRKRKIINPPEEASSEKRSRRRNHDIEIASTSSATQDCAGSPPEDVSNTKRSRKQNNNEQSSSEAVTPGRAGRIARIYLRNFMCHKSLEIKLDLNTNYVIGRNGSGKSALLTALIVGLGGKARATNRGANMKSFIKVGETSATIEITISNTGPMAYNPKLYGSEITIIRNLSDTGGNSYKLKAADGTTVSTVFREVNRLIDSLNIHVDNPVCILNQDVARTFLITNDPSKKYILFMKATNLESVKIQYKLALENKNKTRSVFQEKLDELSKLEVEVKKWLKKHEAIKNVAKVQTTREKLEMEAVWAQINIIEQELKSKEEKVAEADAEMQNYAELVKNERKETLTENVNKIRQQLLEIRNEEEENQGRCNTKKQQMQKLRETLVVKKNEVVSVENTIKRKEIDKQTIEEEISKSSEHHQTKLKMIQERDRNMIKAEEKQNEINKLLETAENDLTQMRSAVNRKKQEQDNLSTELQEVSGKVKQRQAKIRSMKVDENNSIGVYGATTQRILESINAHKEQFKIVPKGPLGSYIKLKDKKWALAIEDFIGTGMLMSFCVDNQNDAKVLSQIFNQVCGNSGRPTIINSKFFNKVHNYSTYKTVAPKGCIAMIDTLTIKDPVAMNCLIDQLSIENILLVSDNNLAINLMSNEVNVPKNCTRVITLTGDQYYPDPNYRSYACRSKNARYLQISASEAIKIYEEELKAYYENENAIRKQLNAVSTDVLKLTKDIRSIEAKCASFETSKMRVEREISDLRLIQLPPEPNLQILTEEMAEVAKIIETKQRDLQKAKDESEMIRKQMTDIENEYRGLHDISKNLESRMRPLILQMTEAESKLRLLNINTTYNKNKLQEAVDILKVATKEMQVKKKFYEKKVEEALKLGEKINTKRTPEAIIKELDEVRQQIQDIKTSLGDKKVISDTYMRMQNKYDKTKNDVAKVRESLNEMIETVDFRRRHYHKLAEYIGVRVREMFCGVLKLRQFEGTIEINHEKKTLELIVIPQHGSSQGTGQTHILSGGERSYSTVAFLHALWQVMEYPFYFLDEFDVFMDKVNRRIVMDILLDHAKQHNYLQFVFLTPQDVSNVVADRKITVHKMADPDRDKRK